jgi:hypothetical protein
MGPITRSFITESTSASTTTPAAYGTNKSLNTAGMCGTNLDASRVTQFRKVTVRFSPYITATSSMVTQPIFAQLGYINIDGTLMITTSQVALSTTQPTQLSFAMPKNMAEYRTANDTNPILTISLTNTLGGSALAMYCPFSVRAVWDLLDDFPNNIA